MWRRLSGFFPVALGFLALVAPTWLAGQRGGPAGSMASAHIGGEAHAGPSFSPAPRSFAPPSGSLLSRPTGAPESFAFRSPGSMLRYPVRRYPSEQAGHPGYRPSPGHPRHPDNRSSGVGYRPYPYINGVYAAWNSYGYGFPLSYDLPYAGDQGYQDDQGNQVNQVNQNDASAQQQQYNEPQSDSQPASGQQDYGPDYGRGAPGPQLAAEAPPTFRPEYQGLDAAPTLQPQPATTLIYNDGRPPAQVHNYALTASTLYSLDGESRLEIPLSHLDVPATVEANRAAGVDFALPVSH